MKSDRYQLADSKGVAFCDCNVLIHTIKRSINFFVYLLIVTERAFLNVQLFFTLTHNTPLLVSVLTLASYNKNNFLGFVSIRNKKLYQDLLDNYVSCVKTGKSVELNLNYYGYSSLQRLPININMTVNFSEESH